MPSQSERRLVFALQVIAKNLGCDLAAGHNPSSERSRSQKTRPNGCRYLPTSQLRTRFTTLLAQWRLHHRCRASTNPRNGYRQCLEPYRKHRGSIERVVACKWRMPRWFRCGTLKEASAVWHERAMGFQFGRVVVLDVWGWCRQ